MSFLSSLTFHTIVLGTAVGTSAAMLKGTDLAVGAVIGTTVALAITWLVRIFLETNA